ncbi:MAG: hypothetical protein IJM09_05590 [Neisseriaceae bacterium]|nr:hypothetical protein [Neisseriaceae bacterium]
MLVGNMTSLRHKSPIKSLYLCYNRTLNQADSHKHNETQRYAAQVSYAFDNAKQNTLFTHFQAA